MRGLIRCRTHLNWMEVDFYGPGVKFYLSGGWDNQIQVMESWQFRDGYYWKCVGIS